MNKVFLSLLLIASGATTAFGGDEALIAERVGNGKMYEGKWGGQVYASMRLETKDRLTACYGDLPCYKDVVYRVEAGEVVVQAGDKKWVYTPFEYGFDAAYYEGDKKLSGAGLR